VGRYKQKYPLFKTFYDAHTNKSSFKKWLTSLPEELIKIYGFPEEFSEKERDEVKQALVLCAVYIVGLQKNNVFATHKQEQIIEARKSLIGAFIALT
jgi:hypothetical protein